MKRTLYATLVVVTLMLITMTCQKEKGYTLEIKDGISIVHNVRPQIDNPKSRLEFVLQIGELEPEDENYLFDQPISATEDHEGNIFILDSQEGVIKKFSSSGEYLFEFGRKGQGPGEFEYPGQIDFRSGQLLVTTMSAQYHIFDINGEYKKKFTLAQYQGLFMKLMDADEVVGYSMEVGGENSKENKILKIFTTDGEMKHSFGEPFLVDKARSSWTANFPHISMDDKNNIFVAFTAQNRIEKYSENGELLLVISRELPFKLEYKYRKENMEIGGQVREIERADFPVVSRGIGIDSQDRIWVLTLHKEIPKDLDGDEFVIQDYAHFEVYSEQGILMAKLPVPDDMERFDNMTMDEDHIYFVDPFGEACVYKYRISWQD